MIVPHDVNTGVAKAILARKIFAIGAVLGPKFGELVRCAVAIRVIVSPRWRKKSGRCARTASITVNGRYVSRLSALKQNDTLASASSAGR